MHTVPPRPAQEYREYIIAQKKRIQNQREHYQINSYGAAMFVGFGLSGLVLVIAMLTSSGWLGLLAAMMAVGSAIVGYNGPAPPLNLSCPHCENSVTLRAQWRCGFCGDDEALWGELKYMYGDVMQGCRSCRRKPLAIECPVCQNDIELEEEHEKAPAQGLGSRGTAILNGGL